MWYNGSIKGGDNVKIIERKYLQELIDVMYTPDIKVITGVRRSGKSKLLEQFQNYIINNVSDANVISINYNSLDYEEYMEYHRLNDYVKEKYIAEKKNFILIDEVQMCVGFEKTINSLHAEGNFDIYITGSNAFLLSSDLSTLFTGRTYEIEVYPFSLKEYMIYNGYDDSEQAFKKYVLEGGMAGSYLYNDNFKKYNYLKDVYDTLILRDIKQKYKIRNNDLLLSLSDYLMDNISNLTSSRSIEKQYLKNGVKFDHKTINNYLNYFCYAFAFYKVRRYDIQGKKYLSAQDKYYIVDQAFKYAKIGTKNMNYGRIYENLVAIELLRRGYEIYVGILYNKEIDFVAIRQNEKIYIQVSDNIEEQKTFDREVDPLLKINDAYPKILIANTKHDNYQYEGILIIDISRWLMDE